MDENELGTATLNAAFKVHTVLGPGLLESVYEAALAFELERAGLHARRQVEIPVQYEGHDLGIGFRADLLVEDRVILELKSVENLLAVHAKTLSHYLRLSGCKLGYLINFNVTHLKDGITRVVNGLPELPRQLPDARRGAERLSGVPPRT